MIIHILEEISIFEKTEFAISYFRMYFINIKSQGQSLTENKHDEELAVWSGDIVMKSSLSELSGNSRVYKVHRDRDYFTTQTTGIKNKRNTKQVNIFFEYYFLFISNCFEC